MADLGVAYDIATKDSLADLRGQISMANWMTARSKMGAGTKGDELAQCLRVLLDPADGLPSNVAIWFVATDDTMQQHLTANNYSVDADTLLNFLSSNWTIMSEIVAGDYGAISGEAE